MRALRRGRAPPCLRLLVVRGDDDNVPVLLDRSGPGARNAQQVAASSVRRWAGLAGWRHTQGCAGRRLVWFGRQGGLSLEIMSGFGLVRGVTSLLALVPRVDLIAPAPPHLRLFLCSWLGNLLEEPSLEKAADSGLNSLQTARHVGSCSQRDGRGPRRRSSTPTA